MFGYVLMTRRISSSVTTTANVRRKKPGANMFLPKEERVSAFVSVIMKKSKYATIVSAFLRNNLKDQLTTELQRDIGTRK